MRKNLPILVASVVLAGCGGGGGSSSSSQPSGRGVGTVSIAWPERSARFIPLAANSVKIDLTLDGATVSQTISRSGDNASLGTATFTGLKYGNYLVTIKAYPTTTATGVAQAIGLGQMAVTEDAPGAATVSLATTVKTVSILPVSLPKASTIPVSISAQDETGAIVLLESSGVESTAWTVDDTTRAVLLGATTGPTVSLKGVHSGATAVHAKLTLGGTTFTADAAVTITAINDGTGTITVQ